MDNIESFYMVLLYLVTCISKILQYMYITSSSYKNHKYLFRINMKKFHTIIILKNWKLNTTCNLYLPYKDSFKCKKGTVYVISISIKV
jgi:hypothetical protein